MDTTTQNHARTKFLEGEVIKLRTELSRLKAKFGLVPEPTTNAKTTLETRFPHVAEKLCLYWDTSEFPPYIKSLLLIDTNSSRVGFPLDVIESLTLLNEVHLANHPAPTDVWDTVYSRPGRGARFARFA